MKVNASVYKDPFSDSYFREFRGWIFLDRLFPERMKTYLSSSLLAKMERLHGVMMISVQYFSLRSQKITTASFILKFLILMAVVRMMKYREYGIQGLCSRYTAGKVLILTKTLQSRGLKQGDNFKSGNLLASRVFGNEARYDNNYYAFGPFNPTEGDYNEKWKSYIFKIVCEGITGDDGNLYRYFLSRDANSDLPIEGANAFTYEYTFRMWNDTKSVAHIYPYVDTGIVSIKQRNFDWDDDGAILVVSTYKQGISVPISNEDDYAESRNSG